MMALAARQWMTSSVMVQMCGISSSFLMFSSQSKNFSAASAVTPSVLANSLV